jgi:hypothetical protein
VVALLKNTYMQVSGEVKLIDAIVLTSGHLSKSSFREHDQISYDIYFNTIGKNDFKSFYPLLNLPLYESTDYELIDPINQEHYPFSNDYQIGFLVLSIGDIKPQYK